MSVQRDVKLRKAAVGTALLLAAPLSVVSWALVPVSMVDAAEFVKELASIPHSTMAVSMVTGVVFFPLAVIGVIGLLHLLTNRPSSVGTIGGGLAIAGLTLNTAAFGAAGTLAEAARSDLSPTQSAALVDATMEGITGILIMFGPLLAAIGTTMLAASLYRARTAPRLPTLMLAIYGPLQLVGFAGEIIPVIIASYAVMALALIPIGLTFIKEPAGDWETPPTHIGWFTTHGATEATAK